MFFPCLGHSSLNQPKSFYYQIFTHWVLQDDVAQYHDILAFLNHEGYNGDNDDSNSSDIGQLKDKLSSFVAYRCKSDSFRFVEYWVPVNISNVQLEQYCAALLSNSSTLRSQSKSHVDGALRDVLITTRKVWLKSVLVA